MNIKALKINVSLSLVEEFTLILLQAQDDSLPRLKET